jgi:hypothetical protein
MSARGRGLSRSRTGAVLAVGMAAALVGLSGCSTEIEGQAQPMGAGGASGAADTRFKKLLEECNVVPHEQIAQVVEAEFVDETFFGAICRFQAFAEVGGYEITLAWFETGSLYRERQTSERLGYSVSNGDVAGQSAIVVTIPNLPDVCGVSTRASDSGIIGWWVRSPAGGVNPCEAATRLTELAVRASF